MIQVNYTASVSPWSIDRLGWWPAIEVGRKAPPSHGHTLPGAIMDPDLASLGDDPDKLKFYAKRYQNKAHKHEAEIDELQYRISVLTKQLEEERARKQDANASGTTPLDGANAPTSAPGPSRSRVRCMRSAGHTCG